MLSTTLKLFTSNPITPTLEKASTITASPGSGLLNDIVHKYIFQPNVCDISKGKGYNYAGLITCNCFENYNATPHLSTPALEKEGRTASKCAYLHQITGINLICK